MKNRSLYTASLCAVLILTMLPTTLRADTHTPEVLTGVGMMNFELFGPVDTPEITGHWTIIRPGNERTEGDDKIFAFSELAAGNYTFTTTLPEGTSAKIDIYSHGELTETIERPQASFTITDGEDLTLKVYYSYTQIGVVAVNSVPPGLTFTMIGPNNMKMSGTTPTSYENYPIGQYAVDFDDIEGCPELPIQSDRLVKDSRITLQVEIVCDNLKNTDLGKNDQKMLEFVTVTVDGKTVVFEDVRVKDWYAPYVYNVAKSAIITGYKDRSGTPEGIFGPTDNVTIAQLAKIAHKFSGIDETKVRVPVINSRAKNQWFERFFASAEQRWWEVWRDKWLDPSRSAKRSEVIATILRAMDVRTVWPEGKTFGDVKPTDKYANAIETAAADGLVDAGGNFRPSDPINRAEMAKIVSKAIEIYIEDTLETQGDSL